MTKDSSKEVLDFLNEKKAPEPVTATTPPVTESAATTTVAATTTTVVVNPPPAPEPAKPKAKKSFEHNRWGAGKFTPPSHLPLSLKMMPPITRKKSATYQLINWKVQDPRIQLQSAADHQNILAGPQELHPTYRIYDRFEEDWGKREKVMRYIGSTQVVNEMNPITKQMESIVKETLGIPIINNGQVVVDIEKEYSHYVWWELHPENASNKFRNPQVRPRFKRVDIEWRSPQVENLRMDLAQHAEKYVLGLDKDGVISVAAAMINPIIPVSGVPIDEIRYNLRLRARNNPEEVMYKSPDTKITTHLKVINALELGIMDFNPEKQVYIFEDNPEGFFEVPIGNPPMEALVSYLITEQGQEDLKFLEDMLSYWK